MRQYLKWSRRNKLSLINYASREVEVRKSTMLNPTINSLTGPALSFSFLLPPSSPFSAISHRLFVTNINYFFSTPPIMVATPLTANPLLRFQIKSHRHSRLHPCHLAHSGSNRESVEEIPYEITSMIEKDYQKQSFYAYKKTLQGRHLVDDDNIVYFKPNPDNKVVACAGVIEGDQICTVYIINVETLEPVGKPLVGIISCIEWAGNGSLLYITTDEFRPNKLWLHKVGSLQSSDSCLYHERDAKFSIALHASRSRKYLFVTSDCGTARSIFYLDVHKLEQGLKILTSQTGGVDKSVTQNRDHLFLQQNQPFNSEVLIHSSGESDSTTLFTQNTRRSFWTKSKVPIAETASTWEGMMLLTWCISYIKLLLSLSLWKSSMLRLINMVLLIILMPFNGTSLLALDRDEKEEISKGMEMVKHDMQELDPTVKMPSKSDLDVLVRREMAIQRVKEDKDGIEMTTREWSLFVTPRGVTLFTQSWTPVSGETKGLVILLHGLNEHSGRYNSFAKKLNANGFKVYGLDWIGHGGSDGLHGYVHSLDDVINDVQAYLDEVLSKNTGLPCFCFGHSTGGAILLKAALEPRIESKINGLILTSPAIGVQPSHPIYTILAPIMSALLPRYQCGAANKKGAVVSRDPDALVDKYSDPLVYTGSLRVRTGYEILRTSKYLQENLTRIRVPFMVLHGTADVITNPVDSEKLYREAESTDKTIKLYEGFLHDLLFEPERESIIHDILEWLIHRTNV